MRSPSGSSPGSARGRAPVARTMCGASISSTGAPSRSTDSFAGPFQSAVPLDDGDLVLPQQVTHSGAEASGHVARALDDLFEIESDGLRGEAEGVEVAEQMIDLRGSQQRLSGNAAPVEADPAQMLPLHDAGLHAELSRANRRDVTARSAAENADVE